MNQVEQAAFQIIAGAGAAKSKYLEAIECAKRGEFDAARDCLDEGARCYLEGHAAHAELLAQSAGADDVAMTLILAHAEDQLLNCETVEILAKEVIELYRVVSR